MSFSDSEPRILDKLIPSEKSSFLPIYISQKKVLSFHEVLKLMSAFTGDRRFEEIINHPENKEVNTMCELLDNIWNDGQAKMLYALVQDGDLSIEKAAGRLNLTIEEFEKKMTEAGFMVPASV